MPTASAGVSSIDGEGQPHLLASSSDGGASTLPIGRNRSPDRDPRERRGRLRPRRCLQQRNGKLCLTDTRYCHEHRPAGGGVKPQVVGARVIDHGGGREQHLEEPLRLGRAGIVSVHQPEKVKGGVGQRLAGEVRGLSSEIRDRDPECSVEPRSRAGAVDAEFVCAGSQSGGRVRVCCGRTAELKVGHGLVESSHDCDCGVPSRSRWPRPFDRKPCGHSLDRSPVFVHARHGKDRAKAGSSVESLERHLTRSGVRRGIEADRAEARPKDEQT